MKLIFQSNNLPFALVIKAFTQSEWHHVGVANGNTVYEARAFGGVMKTDIESYKARGKWFEVEIECDEKKCIHFLEAQVGKPYDFSGAFALPFRANWEDTNKWYCSELAAAAFAYSGARIVRSGLRGVSPRDLWVST